MIDANAKSLASQLKSLAQRVGIKSNALRWVVSQGWVPGIGQELDESVLLEKEDLLAISLAGLLYTHGFQGSLLSNLVKKAVAQTPGSRGTVRVDFRGDYPVQVYLPLEALRQKLR